MSALLRRLNDLFVLWVVLFSLVAYLVPSAFTWFRPYIVPGLGVIMLGMGLTLEPSDFMRVFRRWRAVGVAVFAQFGLMPLFAYLVSTALFLEADLALGLMLVAACPGGTASNVIAYLARADVALSLSMTAVSTVLSPVATPALLLLYAENEVEMAFSPQAEAIAQVILLPVVLGAALRLGLQRGGRRKTLNRLLEGVPSLAVVFIVLIVACIVSLNADRLRVLSHSLIASVIAVNAMGLAAGYGLARLSRLDEPAARAVAIEVGMQNSGLGVALATKFFTPGVALPSAFFSLWHNVTGPALASYWRRRSA